MRTKMSFSSKLYTALIFIFLYAPLAVLVLFSFNSSESTSVFTGFSMQWYRSVLEDTATIAALKNTIKLALCSSVISTVAGTVAAVGIDAFKSKWVKSTVMSVTNLPMMNPDIVTGISMMLLFVFVGRILGKQEVLGFGAMLIAHVTFNLPYVILSVLPKLRQVDTHIPEAAEDLGCTPAQAFFKVVLPMISSGIVTGMMMAFTLSLDDLIISYFTSGNIQTLPVLIFSMTKKRVTPDMYALSTLIFVAILILLIIINVGQIRGDKKMRNTPSRKKRAK